MFKVPEKYRVLNGSMRTTEADGNNGLFFVRMTRKGTLLRIIASDGADWEHVSVSTQTRCPTWSEMSHIRDMFWSPDACVVQYHPPHSEYVNHHPYCLHLWRPIGLEILRPPSILVGPKSESPKPGPLHTSSIGITNDEIDSGVYDA